MLKIRLSRAGKRNAPFYRIVLTEHTRPVKSGYHTMLGFYDPLKHIVNIDVPATKEWVAKGATPSSRVAKILHKHTGDDFFKKYIVITERVRKGKNAPAEEEAPKPAPAAAPQEAAPVVEEVKEEVVEAPKAEEAPAPEAPAEPAAEEAKAE